MCVYFHRLYFGRHLDPLGQGRRLALHAVTCILVWNVRRAIAGGAKDGCLNQEGVQEDLIGMFRRAMEGGLETVSEAPRNFGWYPKDRSNNINPLPAGLVQVHKKKGVLLERLAAVTCCCTPVVSRRSTHATIARFALTGYLVNPTAAVNRQPKHMDEPEWHGV